MRAEILQLGLNQIQFKNKTKGKERKKEKENRQADPQFPYRKTIKTILPKDEQRRKEGVRGGGLLHQLVRRGEGGTDHGNTF